MATVIKMSPVDCFPSGSEAACAQRCSGSRSTSDYRRLLSEMRLRPASQRAFLRRFLKRAAANGVLIAFPVQIPVVVPS
jgi:hypothetical protein